MFIVNHGKKICYWSKGKLGTTTLRLMVPDILHDHGPWEILDQHTPDDVTEINLSSFKSYDFYCPIRNPRSRYYTGVIEDVFNFYRSITGNKSSYDLNDLTVETGWHSTIDYMYQITVYDMSLGLSYHVSNWLYEIYYLTRVNPNVHVFEMSEWNNHYKTFYNIENMEVINSNPNRIKQYVQNFYEGDKFPYLKGLFNNYIGIEEEFYSKIKNMLPNGISGKLVLSNQDIKDFRALVERMANPFVPSSRSVLLNRMEDVLKI